MVSSHKRTPWVLLCRLHTIGLHTREPFKFYYVELNILNPIWSVTFWKGIRSMGSRDWVQIPQLNKYLWCPIVHFNLKPHDCVKNLGVWFQKHVNSTMRSHVHFNFEPQNSLLWTKSRSFIPKTCELNELSCSLHYASNLYILDSKFPSVKREWITPGKLLIEWCMISMSIKNIWGSCYAYRNDTMYTPMQTESYMWQTSLASGTSQMKLLGQEISPLRDI